jgi:hypothetical protein
LNSLSPRLQLIVFIVAAFIVNYIPLLNLPFLWSQTFFNEISHGFAALATGGSIHNIVLRFDGSGQCTTSGGWSLVVSFAGYAGSALWGYFIYRFAAGLNAASSKIMISAMIILLIATVILWARDTVTLLILIVLLAMYSLPLYRKLWFSVASFIRLVGVFIILESIRSPLYLLDGRNIGDGAALAQKTGLPEMIWIVLWFLLALFLLFQLWRSRPGNPSTVR